jgi:hypothetical protein
MEDKRVWPQVSHQLLSLLAFQFPRVFIMLLRTLQKQEHEILLTM